MLNYLKKTHLNKDVCFGHIYIDQQLKNSLDKKQECILCERPPRVSERVQTCQLRLIYNYFGAGNLDWYYKWTSGSKWNAKYVEYSPLKLFVAVSNVNKHLC